MKIPAPKKKIDKKQVDKVAEAYLRAKAISDKAVAETEALYAKAMELAECEAARATATGQRIDGGVYKIAYTEMHNRASLDLDAIRKLIPSYSGMIIRKKTEYVADEEMFQRLVETGQIPAKVAMKIMVPGGLRGKRLSVQVKD